VRLFLVRHAAAAPGDPDELRPLTVEGREQARALGERLATASLEAVVASPLLRARETGAAIARAAGVELHVDERLGPGATAEDLRAAVAGAGAVVAAVGHQPDCSELAAALGAGEVAFPPAGLVELELP
jgi:phosphohistidine phosphatase SixA